MGKKRQLLDEYRFPGFQPRSTIQGIFGDPRARIIRLDRTEKKRRAVSAELHIGATTTRQCGGYETYCAGMLGYSWSWKYGESGAKGAGK